MRRSFFDYSGLRLSYLEAGLDGAPKLFIAHANGYAAGCYEFIVRHFSDQYHVCALDFAGHGESASTLDFKSWNFFSDQILAFLDHKRWQKTAAIGHSLGGGSLVRAAIKEPNRFEKLVLFDPVVLGFLAITYVKLFGNPMARTALARREDFQSKEQALKIFMRHPANRSWEKDAVKAYVDYCIKEDSEGAILCCLPEVEAQIFSQTNYGHLFKLGRIRAETHIVLPPHSNVCPTRVARRIVRNNERSSLLRVPGTGHLLPFENRQLTLQTIEAALGR
jgi:pimeloyl-ACP methyl ester carboxylesterase